MCARTAFVEDFSTRWGIWVFDESPGLFVVFSNHFYKNFPERRSEEIDELKRRFTAAGFEVLGLSTYPTSGPSDGHSYAMAVRGREDQRRLVASIQDDVVDSMLSRCDGDLLTG